MLHPGDFFDLQDDALGAFFTDCDYVWEAIPRIAGFVNQLTDGKQTILGDVLPGAFIGDAPVFVAEGARIEPGAYVLGPAYIGPGAVVRHGAFVRENVVLLEGAMLGHASEAKNALFLPHAHAPHFNYVGDSMLGHHVNLGAGTKLSNLGMMSEKDALTGKRPSITFQLNDAVYDMGIAKMGAIMGDASQTGCNSVLNPGCLIGPRTLVYANMSVRKGFYPPNSIIKLRQTIEVAERR